MEKAGRSIKGGITWERMGGEGIGEGERRIEERRGRGEGLQTKYV